MRASLIDRTTPPFGGVARRALVPAIVAMLLAATGVAAADAQCTFIEISATKAKDPKVDPELKPLEKKLGNPPFQSWNVFHQLSSASKTLVKNKSQEVTLKGGKLNVLLRGQTASQIQLELHMDDASGTRILNANPDLPVGEYLILGTNDKNNGHLLAMSCK